jgi:BirA family transcriptional regulator, biotin operon repressor / biotin---[acetyl-CoA-carboxylase] ligase
MRWVSARQGRRERAYPEDTGATEDAASRRPARPGDSGLALSRALSDWSPRGRFGHPYVYEPETESTQLLIGPDAPEGTVAVADFQSRGRGRLGRHWEAPPGTAIHCSVALRPPARRSPQELTLVGAVAAADAIELETELFVQIKWPNDVMLNRRKVGGVLGELRDGLVVLGIGINVNQTREQLPPDAKQPAGSLRTITGREHERASVLSTLLVRLEHHYNAWRGAGLAALYPDIGARDFLRGRRVSVDGLSGTAVGIDRAGRLELEVDGGRRLVESGEVRYY